ncbi:hypothetical protein Tco_0045796 [Tanacetum coccineum]
MVLSVLKDKCVTDGIKEKKELSGDQVYWLSANEIASQASKPATPATPFVHKSRPPSQVLASLQKVNAVFPQLKVVQIVLWYLDSGCSRHMTGDRARLINFVEKFMYRLKHQTFPSLGQFCDGGLEVAFRSLHVTSATTIW